MHALVIVGRGHAHNCCMVMCVAGPVINAHLEQVDCNDVHASLQGTPVRL